MSLGASRKYPFGVYTGVKTALSVPTKNSADLSPQEMEREVKDLLGYEGYKKLHRLHKKDQHDPKNGPAPSPTAHRDFFAMMLDKHMSRIPSAVSRDKTITLREFFSPSKLLVKGKEDELKNYQDLMIKLYKNALKEESNSPEFRNAVFLQSCQPKMGVKFDQKYAEHISGPSGGGKSKARDKVTAAIMKEEKEKQEQQTGGPAIEDHLHHFVSVDGGFDRDVSQVRGLLFSAVLEKGYKGPEDLQKHSKKTAMKNKVKNAVLASQGHFHLVLPDTFTDPFKRYGQAIFSKLSRSGYKQIFVTVIPDQEQTFVSGNSRAWMKSSDQRKVVRDPNLKDKPEGKRYEPELFEAGIGSSKLALKIFNKLIGGRTFEIDNDVLYLRKNDSSPSGYSRCTKENYEYDLISNKRVFSSFESFNNRVLIDQLEKLKQRPDMGASEKFYIDKMMKVIDSLPEAKDKNKVIKRYLESQEVPDILKSELKKLVLPVENYNDWVQEVTVIKASKDISEIGKVVDKQQIEKPDEQRITMPHYYIKLWEANGKKEPLDELKKRLDNQFGIVLKETTDPKLKAKIESEQYASSAPKSDVPTASQVRFTQEPERRHSLQETEQLPSNRERRGAPPKEVVENTRRASFMRREQPDPTTPPPPQQGRRILTHFWSAKAKENESYKDHMHSDEVKKESTPQMPQRRSFKDSVLGLPPTDPQKETAAKATLPKSKGS